MNDLALLILQVGLGITFICTGFFILTDKKHWTDMILPRAERFVIGSKKTTMILVGVYDIFNGIWLITGILVWVAALFAALHMIQVFFAAGFDDVTYRDFGIMTASLALAIATFPPGLIG